MKLSNKNIRNPWFFQPRHFTTEEGTSFQWRGILALPDRILKDGRHVFVMTESTSAVFSELDILTAQITTFVCAKKSPTLPWKNYRSLVYRSDNIQFDTGWDAKDISHILLLHLKDWPHKPGQGRKASQIALDILQKT